MKTDIFKIIIFNYGIGFEFLKNDYNPITGDGSLSKFKFYKSWYKYSNPFFVARFFYNYTFLIRLYLDRG